MGLLFGKRALDLSKVEQWAERVGYGNGASPAGSATALRHSGVWAALRLRANLISTLPVDVFTKTGPVGAEIQKPATKTRLFTRPADGMLWHEWLYATQMDLDRFGNCFGHIAAREGGWPAQVELWSAADVSVIVKGGLITGYRHGGETFAPVDVWHERQYVAAGIPVGLSPVAYAAWSIGGYLSAQQFALDWFTNGAHPAGTLRHTEEANLDPKVLSTAKARFKVATQNGDIFATGKEWEYTPGAIDANTAQFIEQQRWGINDVARWFDVPSDSIDGSVSGQSVTYANVSQRQLNLLVNHLAPAITRRELSLSANALPAPRFVKLNSDALLRLDPTARTELLAKQIDAWMLTPDEGRALADRPPLTPEQIALLIARDRKLPTQEVPK